MRILFLALDVDLRQARGESTHTLNLARALAKRGNEITLVVARGPASDAPTHDGLGIREIPPGGDLATIGACAEMAKAVDADLLYERRYSPKIAYGTSRKVGLPYVVEVNGIVEDEVAAQGRTLKGAPGLRRVKAAARGHSYRKAAAIVAVSPGIGRFLVASYRLDPSRVSVVPNGVDPELFAPADRPASRRDLGLPETPPLVTFVGNLVAWQGLEVLVRAIPSVLASLPEARFVLVGDGPSGPSLRALATDLDVGESIQFPGSIPYGEVARWIGAADACVAPFTRERNVRAELSPLKLYEYLACARPVVVSDIPGVSDLVRGAGAGVVVPPDDPEALGEGIVNILADPEAAEAMGARGREAVLEGYTWDHTAAKVEAILRGVA